ncbi:hypothetical protein GDO81_006064 [Engystomops pustulosus]|uniref:Secreted protein n=1 Tax=Engystomops pustulosus TaxID=76066 RepID=A0AAV7CUA3_ENGPU|nr:hypothetical protein GDO81_006064 [Engystomops pustulosus]
MSRGSLSLVFLLMVFTGVHASRTPPLSDLLPLLVNLACCASYRVYPPPPLLLPPLSRITPSPPAPCLLFLSLPPLLLSLNTAV